MKISNFAIRRPVFTIVSMFLVIILGAVSLLNIPMKLIPDINPPVGVVVTSYQGASPEEIVEKITKPLESNLATLPGIKTITSSSQEGSNLILMQFSWTTNIDEIQNEILQRIDQTPIPDGADKPRFLKFDPSQFPIIQLSLRSDDNVKELREISSQLKLELTKVNGVASVNLSGTTEKEIYVELDQEKLKDYSLAYTDVVNVIRSNNISMPGDTVISGDKELTTRVSSDINSLEVIKDLFVTINPINGERITMSEISTIKMIDKDDRTITRTNQSPSVLISVLQQSDANTATVSKEFKKELDDLLATDKYEGIEADILFDQGDFIQLAIGNITNSLILGGLFAMVVLFFFLRSIKSPIIIGVAIPYSVIFTFVLMYFSNFTLNIMTLGGLALGIGMLVDNSIVVIENIYRHLSMGKDSKEAAMDGTKEVGAAITASTLTTVAVFLPVVFISGIIGQLFTEFALTISFSLFASLIVALTVVPMLASRFLKPSLTNIEQARQQSALMNSLERSIKWALRNRALVITTTIVLLVLGSLGITTVGTQFLPSSDEGFFSIRVELENGTALKETEKVMLALEQELKDKEDVDVYVSLIGTTQEGTFRGSKNANIGELYVKMKDFDERSQSTFQFVDKVKKELERSARKVNAGAQLSFNLQSSAGSAPNTLSFSVRDTDPLRLKETADRIFYGLNELDNVNELTTDVLETVEEIQISVDREKAFDNGLSPSQIAMVVNDVTRGIFTTQVVDENSSVHSVYVQYDKQITKDLDNLKGLLIRKPDGNYISLDKLTNIKVGSGPVQIQRINQQPAIQFTLKYKSTTNLGAISKEVDKVIEDLKLADETEVVFGGDRDLLESSMDDLFLAFILANIFIYLVMAAQFESLKYPLVIMFTVPLMVIGVAIALTLTRTPVSLTAIIGIIVLAGIVVNNAIVIIDYIIQKKEQGLKTYDAIVIAVKDRARPIFMTALTTILALIPLALGIGEGTEMNQPMGITVIGGLISSTFLTLFVIPVVYSYFDKSTRNLNKMYATPEGHLIPAYLLEDKLEATSQMEPKNIENQKYSRSEMAGVLEEILKVIKEEKKK